MPTVKETFDAMPSRFKPDRAAGTNAVIQYDIGGEGGGTWHAVIKDGMCSVAPGPGSESDADGPDIQPGLARHARGQTVRADALHVGPAQGQRGHGARDEARLHVLDVAGCDTDGQGEDV